VTTETLVPRRVTTGALTREAALARSQRQGEPEWLRAQRLAAWELADRLPFPTGVERAWKYLNPDRLRLESLRLPDGAVRRWPAAVRRAVHKGEQAGVLTLADEQLLRAELDEAVRGQGVIFTSLSTAVRIHPDLVQPHLGSVVRPDENVFVALNSAFWSGGVFVYVPREARVTLPLHAVLAATGGSLGLFPRVLIVLERGAQVAVVEETVGGAEGTFVGAVIELVVGDEARLHHYRAQRWQEGVQEVFFQRARLGRHARLVTAFAGLGGEIFKGWIESEIRGTGAGSEMYGLVYGTGRQHFDVITLQDHIGDHSVSDLLIKAALRDQAQSAYYGLTRVGRTARMADANQENRNLLLSDKAKAEADPVLEILTSEVQRCAHGASAGPVDLEQLFYLESRGLPRPQAERLLVQGFLGEVLARLPDEAARAILERAVAAKLESEVGAISDG
jgi:Fe-S cluster assembly protein SufD